MRSKVFLLLMTIVFLGGWLRFWQLASHPVSLTIDETAIAYNAYSILKTGRDEHGQLLPLAFRSIGDYKPPVLIYLMVPAVAVFGLNEFGTRLTIALVGTATIIVVYLLTQELTKNKVVSLLTSLSLAISPWHIQFSRATFEAILALFLMITGAWLFLRATRLKGKLLWLSAIFFALAMYSYHAERVVVPLLVLVMAIIYRQKLGQYRHETLKAVLVGLIISWPLLNLMLGPEGQTRAIHGFINRDFEIAGEIQWAKDFSGVLATLFGSNPLILFNFWLKRYLDYWNLRFLFLKGINLTLPGLADVGLFHLFEMVPFLFGVWLIFFRKKILEKKKKKLFVWWLLIGPLAASLANNSRHPLRSLTTIPAPQILVGIGGFWLLSFLKRQGGLKRFVSFILAVLVLTVSLVYYFDLYFLHFPIHYSDFWDYGMKEIAQYAWQHQDEYEEIVVDPTFGREAPNVVRAPYLYFLFYHQYDPYLFQHSPRRIKAKDAVDFENFTFRQIYWPEDRTKENTLFIGSPWRLPAEDISPSQIKREIKFKNGVVGFLIVETE